MNILKNIKQLADNEGISIGFLEKKIGASKGVLSRAIANNTDIQAKWICLIVENYPQYNSEWLLTNKGEMLKLSISKSDPKDDYIIELQKQRIAELEKKLAELEQKANKSSLSAAKTVGH